MSTIPTTFSQSEAASKAAEIYRRDSGQIYYVCFHCGANFSSISETLTHIELHFNATNHIKEEPETLDIVDIKCEIVDNVSQETDLEQIFIDCNKSLSQNEEQCLRIDTTNYSLLPVQQTVTIPKGSLTDVEDHFELKCLYCSKLCKTFVTLKLHLRRHVKEPLPNIVLEAMARDQTLKPRPLYSLKCTLCPSEFYDSDACRQHVRDNHDPEPIKCIPCGRIFVSTQLLKDHMISAHITPDLSHTNQTNTANASENDPQTSKNTMLTQYNTFLCILCDKTFNGTLNLMQHTFVHFNLKNFSCPQCPAAFQRMSTINEHMTKKHSVNVDKQIFNIQCRFCSEKIDNFFDFVTHTFTNHLDEGDRNNSDLDPTFCYDCRFCFKKFDKWNEAFVHLKVHANDQLVKCTTSTARNLSERAKSGLYRYELLYNCKFCMKTLCGSFEARNHLKTDCEHVPDLKMIEKKGFKCQDCDGSFSSEFSLMRHRLMHFKVMPYRCMICAKQFSVRRNATLHMIKIHHMQPNDNFSQLECHYCKAEFKEETDFITHMFDEHLYVNFDIEENLDGEFRYECLYCNEYLSERSRMTEHLLKHAGETIINVVSTESPINALRHNVEFLYCCVFCPKKFRLPHPANEHSKYKHRTEKTSKEKVENKSTRDTYCNLCNITFMTSRSMANHRAKRHPETHNKNRYKNRPTYYCSTCGKAYQDRGNLNQHEETHARLQSFTCDICKKTYRTKNYLQTHMLSHTNEKNFICEHCGRSFYSVSKLNTHYQIHQNLKLQCDQCDKVFFTRYNLSKHRKTHSTDTRKKCKLCDKYFKSTESYRTHMLLHTGVKKYACRYCDMTFAQSSGRRGHEKIRHHIA
ncbi:Zinc finger protein [Pseudolycoriella hygida]|uniref:Zinc finger protein n=1 Tax=Pseudolycoriella hygida TaxID=35572 RepID=A0A9Q0N2Z0_9DIPT|nr:Zinc finger protein [Pseudolycoriella hygida]